MTTLFGKKFHIKQGKVLLVRPLKTKEEVNNQYKLRQTGIWKVIDIAKNVNNFTRDFPVEVGDSVVLENSFHCRVLIDFDNKLEFAVVNSDKPIACFKGGFEDEAKASNLK